MAKIEIVTVNADMNKMSFESCVTKGRMHPVE